MVEAFLRSAVWKQNAMLENSKSFDNTLLQSGAFSDKKLVNGFRITHFRETVAIPSKWNDIIQ